MSSKFARDLKASLKEAIAHKEGKLELYSEYIQIPELAIEYKAKDIKKIRGKKTLLTRHVRFGTYC